MAQILTLGEIFDSIARRAMDANDRRAALRDINLLAEKGRKILAISPHERGWIDLRDMPAPAVEAPKPRRRSKKVSSRPLEVSAPLQATH